MSPVHNRVVVSEPPSSKRVSVLRAWDDGERDRYAIAEANGVKVETVTVWLSQAGRLKTDDKRYYKVFVPANVEKVAAERYGCTGQQLVKRMVQIIDSDDLYAAIFDDKPG